MILVQFSPNNREVQKFLCSGEKVERLHQVQKCHSGFNQIKKASGKRFLGSSPLSPFILHSGTFYFHPLHFQSISAEGGAAHLLMNKLQLSLGPLVQGDGSFGNRRKSGLINGDINHGLARLAERRSVSRSDLWAGLKRKR